MGGDGIDADMLKWKSPRGLPEVPFVALALLGFVDMCNLIVCEKKQIQM
jgi:hypothetical protein